MFGNLVRSGMQESPHKCEKEAHIIKKRAHTHGKEWPKKWNMDVPMRP